MGDFEQTVGWKNKKVLCTRERLSLRFLLQDDGIEKNE